MQEELLEDINRTLKLIKNEKKNSENRYSWITSEGSFSKISKCYSFSNENLREYYKIFDIKDKNVLTVCGSGDQVLSSILYGAKNIDTFDSNKLAYYNLFLKKYAIEYLNYNEFIKFYNIYSKNLERINYYEKIASKIKENDVIKFWNSILSKNDDVFTYCFLNKEKNHNLLKKRIPYMDKKNYNLLKNKINDSDITFVNTDIFNISNIFKKEYSFINLSNILQYIKNKDDFIELIAKLSVKNLDNNGSILLDYIWNCGYDNHSSERVFNYFKAKEYIIQNLELNEKSEQGKIMVYTKKSLK